MIFEKCEILCIGTELLMGAVVNTNAPFIARHLAEMGINLYHQTVVGDNPARLKEALELAFSRADLVITTGGLGPTYDDLSKETVAEYFGLPLEPDADSLKQIEAFFEKLEVEMTENNKKQALFPKGAVIFPNPNGTAPGCAVSDGKKTAILLPGPPREMGPMFENSVVPYMTPHTYYRLVSRNLHFFGVGEAMLENALHDLMSSSMNPTIAPYAKTGEVMLRVTARVSDEGDAPAMIDPIVEQIKEVAGRFLYGIDVDDLQTAAVRALQGKGLQVAVAESCTGGMLAQRLTSVPGASAVFECGMCCYSARMKQELLGVEAETLEQFGAVSKETAVAMAKAIRKKSGAEVGVAVTGNAGPATEEDKPLGLVFVAVESDRFSSVRTLNLNRQDQDARNYIRTLASSHALSLILKASSFYSAK